jgi:hypothetical protein
MKILFREPEALNTSLCLFRRSQTVQEKHMGRDSYLRKNKQIKRKEIIFELEEWAKIEEGANRLGTTTSDYIRNRHIILSLNLKESDIVSPYKFQSKV